MKQKIKLALMKLMNIYCSKTPWHTSECEHCICNKIRCREGCFLEHLYQKVARW